MIFERPNLPALIGEIVPVRIVEVGANSLFGALETSSGRGDAAAVPALAEA